MSKPLLAQDVADRFGVSVSRVVALDGVLEPARTPRGVRVYESDRIEFYAGCRAAKKGSR